MIKIQTRNNSSFFSSILLLSAFFLCSYQTSDKYRIIEDQAKIPILTPTLKDRQTTKIRLANGLEAFIISDPHAIKSGAALVVEVGSWSDPPEYPGLAHFLEHMLFLGTEKYPIESEYDRFIKEHNGQSNAYTASDHTLYLFSVRNDAFTDALDRFASFFTKPLFNPSGVSRELQAINQEFAKNFSEDNVREYYVYKELSDPKHPFHNFSSGNASTLLKVSQKVLKDWYKENYSANLMHLIIYSPLPLDTLKKLVVEDFSDVPNHDKEALVINEPLTTAERKNGIVYVDPLRDIRELRLIWELPTEFANMKDSKPAEVICYLLGHEGPGSFLAGLKNENLAENITCSGHYLSSRHYIMSLDIELTEKGLKDVNGVIEKFFAVINQLKRDGIPFFIFDEDQKISTLSYQYQPRKEPFEFLMDMGEWLIREKLETFPEQSLIIQKFDPEAIKQLLNFLTPSNTSFTIAANSELTQVNFDRKEKWMGVPYAIKPIAIENLKRWENPQFNHQWHLPDPNPFIPKNVNISVIQERDEVKQDPIPHPEVIINQEDAKIYYSKDEVFLVPKTVWSFEIKTPQVTQQSPTQMALTELYSRNLKELLNLYSYNAKIAELEYEIEAVDNGIRITIQGYQDNAETLFDMILNNLKKPPVSEEVFKILKDSLIRQYQNFTQESPLKQGIEVYQSVIHQHYSTFKQKAEALQKISYEDLLNFIKHLYDKSFTYGLVYGNIEKDQALRLWEKLSNALNSSPYPKNQHSISKIIDLPNDGPFFVNTPIEFAGHTAILGIEDILFSFKTRAAQQILAKAMSGPFYSTLRTKQQTGYIVFNKAEELERHLFSFFAVQSNTHEPRDLLARFELFIEDFLQEMTKSELTEERFSVIRKSLQEALELPPQNLIDMADLLKILAFKYDGDFDWVAKRINGFKELKYEEFLEIASQFLGRANKKRLAVLIEGKFPNEERFKYFPLQNLEEIRRLSKYTYFDIPKE